MLSLKELEQRVKKIEERNRKVEADKAWETSWARRFLVMAFTYLAIGFYLQAISVAEPWLNAIIPTAAFLLSTLTIPFFKKQWLKRFYKR
ncbi:hypothetical protein H0N95_02490 [Candidatus Micrarchaeota archaeon]|nr:hypothetical protein [Candidatus Micrarchaeota archaeon]